LVVLHDHVSIFQVDDRVCTRCDDLARPKAFDPFSVVGQIEDEGSDTWRTLVRDDLDEIALQ